MSCNLVLIPTEQRVGSSAVRLGLQHALEQNGYSVLNFHPFTNAGISNQKLQSYFLENRRQELLEEIVRVFDSYKNKADFILIQGIYCNLDQNSELKWFSPYTEWFNSALIRTIIGYAIFIVRPNSNNLAQIEEKIDLAIQSIDNEFILGAIVTQLNAPVDDNGKIKFNLLDEENHTQLCISPEQVANLAIFKRINLLGITQWDKAISQPRIIDVMKALQIAPLIPGMDDSRRVRRISMCSRTINNLITDLKPGTLLVTAIDRADIIMASAMAESNGIKLAGLLLTADYSVPRETLDFCYKNHDNQLPIYANRNNRKTLSIIMQIQSLDLKGIPADDLERINLIKEKISEAINITIIKSKLNLPASTKMSPAAFRHMLLKFAQQKKPRIILPEGEEIRTLTAAIHCQEKRIANCILLGNPAKIQQLALTHMLQLPEGLQILDPLQIAPKYVPLLVELRKQKGMTPEQALDTLTNDNNYLGTMLIKNDEADGLVSGAQNTTAATVRPALQIIKTKAENKLVSSVFFMCMEDQVIVYGDCAINPDPNANELAEIAIQSAETALNFNVEPRIAMISYSTGSSGTGADVDKVKEATALIRKLRPDLIVDGPLQYDAAMIPDVARKKAPNSQVAGRATVCIFPDLNTGNTTYKAVQRSANVLSIGPVLQGLNRPVNDLSRGATIDDIIYTIAITAVQC